MYSSPEFVATVQVVPFDPEAELQAVRYDEQQAVYRFHRLEETQENDFSLLRGCFFGLAFTALFGALGYACYLLAVVLSS